MNSEEIKVKWMENLSYSISLLPIQELADKTHEIIWNFLTTGEDVEESDYLVKMNNIVNDAANGNMEFCDDIASIFTEEKWAEIADPYMSFNWYSYAKKFLDQSNARRFSGMPGGYRGVIAMFDVLIAKSAVLIGNHDDKLIAVQSMKEYILNYGREYHLWWTDFIRVLCGIPAYKTFENLHYDLSDVVDINFVTKLYKELADHYIYKEYYDDVLKLADEFETHLHIMYVRPIVDKIIEEKNTRAEYRSQGVCQYCGNKFKGFFTKICVSCGKTKDY